MTTVEPALRAAAARLAATSPTARLDAEVLLGHVLGAGRAQLLAHGERRLDPDEAARYRQLVERRAAGEPVAYLVGQREFYGLPFLVDRRVLIPRPETELLVELVLARARGAKQLQTIADIGTGSGAIAVALAVSLPTARVYAVDISPDALAVARSNVERNGVAGRVRLILGDGCAALPEPVDLVAANPPYTILDQVEPDVRRWEPQLALDGGGPDGWDAPRRLLAQLPGALRPGGSAFVEIGAWQGRLALDTARELFPAASIMLHQDLAGRDRVIELRVENGELRKGKW